LRREHWSAFVNLPPGPPASGATPVPNATAATTTTTDAAPGAGSGLDVVWLSKVLPA